MIHFSRYVSVFGTISGGLQHDCNTFIKNIVILNIFHNILFYSILLNLLYNEIIYDILPNVIMCKGALKMAKVKLFMFSEAIHPELSADGKLIQTMKNPIPVLRPQFIPSNYSFGLAFSIQELDIHADNHLRITIYDPSINLIYDSNDTSIKSSDLDTLPTEQQGFMICADFRNVILKEEGIYLIKIILNGESIYEHDLPVYVKKDIKEMI